MRNQIPALIACLIAATAHADEPDIEFSGSGFLTIAAGKVLSGGGSDPAAVKNVVGYTSPIFITDYAQGGVYESKGWSLGPDSKLGLQGGVEMGKFSVTGQVVSRGARDGKINLEWVYGGYKLNDNITVQVGRKRLPLFYYSESQDVGLSFPWVHLPPQVYGWEIVNYNGANVLYRDKWSNGWTSSLNVFGGQESRNDNGFWKIYNGKHSRSDSKWTNIAGAELSLLPREWLEARAVYIQSDIQDKEVTDNNGVRTGESFSPKAKQKIYGLSMSADYGNWVVRAEALYINRKETYGGDRAYLLGVGRRFDKWLPMLTYARYKQMIHNGNPEGDAVSDFEGHDLWSATLRYDLTTSSDIKVQLDRWNDKSGKTYIPYGSSTLLSISYDVVF